MTTVSSFPFALQVTPRISWSTDHEKSISRDYPFTDLAHETPEQYVVRTYLQFLWLPESIMPLKLLVPALKRVKVASTSSESPQIPHPLHALLDPLLLTARSAANKYHVELPQILSDGGGAGEIEETMMWYALSYEKGDEDQERRRMNSNSSEQSADTSLWTDDKWRTKWLRRLERREVQIQIILHLLILSLPGPTPAPPESPELSSVKRRKRPRKKVAVVSSPEDRLEAFMDKLSMWQLMGDLDSSETRSSSKPSEELDWMQLFCRDTIEPQFKSSLPTSCDLLRTKIFPNSPFSDTEDEPNTSRSSDARTSSPEPPTKRARGASSLAKTASTSTISNPTVSVPVPVQSKPSTRYPSPALSTTSTSSRLAQTAQSQSQSQSQDRTHEPTQKDPHRTLSRSRSRSLSVSLAEEKEQKEKEKELGDAKRRRVPLNREVSMSRVFKGKGRALSRTATTAATTTTTTTGGSGLFGGPRRMLETTVLVKAESKDEGITLVEDTPVKPTKVVSRSQSQWQSQPGSQFRVHPQTQPQRSSGSLFSRSTSLLSTTHEEEEIWDISESSPPSVILLTPGVEDSEDEEDDSFGAGVMSTPTKIRRAQIQPS